MILQNHRSGIVFEPSQDFFEHMQTLATTVPTLTNAAMEMLNNYYLLLRGFHDERYCNSLTQWVILRVACAHAALVKQKECKIINALVSIGSTFFENPPLIKELVEESLLVLTGKSVLDFSQGERNILRFGHSVLTLFLIPFQ